MHFKTSLIASASALLIGAVAAPVASAQTDETTADSGRRLNTVTVTSTKREQTLQDIPVAVSVVDEQTIEKAEILDLIDLQSVVPSLRVDQYQSSAQTAFRIRGFGNGDNNAGVEPSVGVFIDGVYRSRSAAQIADLPNLQRVEVLRGPQSTLFGKNASAGVISIVTQEPQFEQQGSVEASVGNLDLIRVAGDVTGPLNDKVAYSLAANYNSRNGYADELTTRTELNDRNRWGVRGQLLFTPNDDLKIRLIGDYDHADENCCYANNVVNGPTGAVIFGLGGQLVPNAPFSREVYYNFAPTAEVENSGISGQVDYDFDFATFTSITSLRNSNFQQDLDGDFTSADLIQKTYTGTDIDTFTQEFRLTSQGGEKWDWMVGAFYFDESIDIESQLELGSDYRGYADFLSGGTLGFLESQILGVPVGTFGQAGIGYDERFTVDNQAWSIFGTIDAYITDKLTATIGLNYTEDEKTATGNVINTDAFSALDFVAIGNQVIYQTAFAQTLAGFGIDPTNSAQVAAFAAANPAGFAQIQAGSQAFADANDTNPAVNQLLGYQALQFLPPFVNFPNSVEPAETSDDALTYTIRLAYDLTNDINLYGSIATGFKATSWNLSRDSRPVAADIPLLQAAGLGVPNLNAGTRFASPEDAMVYEIGLKAQFDTVSVNLAWFDQTIKDFQNNSFIGTGFALNNAGEQSSKGIEVEVNWSPIEGLNLFYAGLHMDPVYDEYVTATVDLSGETPQGLSDNSVSVGGSYDWTLPNGWDAYVRADYQYESKAYTSDDTSDERQTKQVDVVNASFGIETQNGLRVALWGRNIFDDEYLIETFPSVAQAGSFTGYPSPPATYGLTVSKDF